MPTQKETSARPKNATTPPRPALDDIWQRLAAAVDDANAPFRTPAIAVTDEAGGPTVRIVVLRRVDAAGRAVVFHTDVRSAKWAMLRARPVVEWVFWDESIKLQLRLRTTASLHVSDAVSADAWDEMGDHTRDTYRTPRGPGTPIADNETPGGAPSRDACPDCRPSDDAAGDAGPLDDPAARAQLGVVVCRAESIDWLVLSKDGNRRFKFDFQSDASNSIATGTSKIEAGQPKAVQLMAGDVAVGRRRVEP